MDFLEYVWKHGYDRAEVSTAEEERWTKHVEQMYEVMLMRKAKSSADIRAIFAGGDYTGKEDKKRAGSGKKRTKK